MGSRQGLPAVQEPPPEDAEALQRHQIDHRIIQGFVNTEESGAIRPAIVGLASQRDELDGGNRRNQIIGAFCRQPVRSLSLRLLPTGILIMILSPHVLTLELLSPSFVVVVMEKLSLPVLDALL